MSNKTIINTLQRALGRMLTIVMGISICVATSPAAHRGPNTDGTAIGKLSSPALLERSIRFIKDTQQPDSALVYLKVLGSRKNQSSMTDEEADVISRGLTVLGGVYINDFHDYSNATKSFLEARDIARMHDSPLRIAESEVALATLNLASLNYEDPETDGMKSLISESMEMYENAFRLAYTGGDGNLMGFAAVNMGLLGFDTQNLQKTTDTLIKAAEDPRVANWQRLLCKSFILWHEGKNDEAMQVVVQSRNSLAQSGKEARYRLQNDKIRMQMLLMAGKKEEAIGLGKEIAQAALAEDDAETAYEAYRLLWNNTRKEGDKDSSQKYELEMLRARLAAQHTDVPGAISEGKMQYRLENP